MAAVKKNPEILKKTACGKQFFLGSWKSDFPAENRQNKLDPINNDIYFKKSTEWQRTPFKKLGFHVK